MTTFDAILISAISSVITVLVVEIGLFKANNSKLKRQRIRDEAIQKMKDNVQKDMQRKNNLKLDELLELENKRIVELERWPQAELERQRIRDRKEGTIW